MEELQKEIDELSEEGDELEAPEMMMQQEEDPNDCEECGNDLTHNKVTKTIGGTEYCFCSKKCVEEFLKHFG